MTPIGKLFLGSTQLGIRVHLMPNEGGEKHLGGSASPACRRYKPVVIAGDNDVHDEQTQGFNPGRTKAEEAAHAMGGKAFFPVFASGEQSENPKAFTDFNDLAVPSILGKTAIERQTKVVVAAAVESHKTRMEQARTGSLAQRQERGPRAIRRGVEGQEPGSK